MAYRKTEKVLAQLEAKRQTILDVATDIIAKRGLDALSTDLVCERAKIGLGSLYRDFADKHEIWAAIIARALARDVGAIDEADSRETYPINAFARALGMLYDNADQPRLARALAASDAYREAVGEALAGLIGQACPMPPSTRKRAAAASLAILAMAERDSRGAKGDTIAFILRGIGVPARAAEAMAR